MKPDDLARELRELADRVEATSERIEVGGGPMTLPQAVKVLRDAMPKSFFAVYLQANCHSDGETSIGWSVGTPTKAYSSVETLDRAVRDVLEDREPKQPADLDAVQAVLDSPPDTTDAALDAALTDIRLKNSDPPF